MVTCEMEEPDIEVSVNELALVHTDISLLRDGRTDVEVSVSAITLVHTDISLVVLLGFSVVDAQEWGPRTGRSEFIAMLDGCG